MATNYPATFGEALAKHARERPTQIALRHDDRITDYATLDRQASQIAAGLHAMGLMKGARVAYIGKNSDRAIALTLGAARAGIVFVPIIWRLAPAEIAGILEDAAPGAIFVEPAFAHCVADRSPVLIMDEAFDVWREAQPDDALPVGVEEDGDEGVEDPNKATTRVSQVIISARAKAAQILFIPMAYLEI